MDVQENFLLLKSNPHSTIILAKIFVTDRIDIGKEKHFPKLKTLKITRIGRGLPTGADLEYADELTLQRAMEGRTEY